MQKKRLLIKLSGEGFANKEKGLLIDPCVMEKIVSEVKILTKAGYQIAIVVGGGNFWRGKTAAKNGINSVRADYIGMLATTMNGLALLSMFEKKNIKARVQSSIFMDLKIVEPYINEKAIHFLDQDEVLIFTGGTGRPFFTTDTAATLIAAEINAKSILVGKNGVDGIYDSDPKINTNAKKYDKISYDEIIIKKLKVMDITAISIAQENKIEIIVFDINEKNSLSKVMSNKISKTIVSNKGENDE